MPQAGDGYYWSLGRMICRAAEAEMMMEALARDLEPERDAAYFSGMAAERVASAIKRSADRWPSQQAQVLTLVEVMREGADVRNWLVHAWVVPSVRGDWVELQKPMKKAAAWGISRIRPEEVDMLTARFRWVLDAVVRVVNDHDGEVQGAPPVWADPLGSPPPLPASWQVAASPPATFHTGMDVQNRPDHKRHRT